MKKLLLVIGALSLTLTACGGGGGSSTPAPVYLPAGTYNSQYTNLTNNCTSQGLVIESQTGITSNGSGQICSSAVNGSICNTVNLVNNPCAYSSVTSSGVTTTLGIYSCQLTATGMTGTINGSVSSSSASCQVTGTYTLTLQ